MSITHDLIWIFLFTGIILFVLFLKDSRSKKKNNFFGDSITQYGDENGGYISLIRKMFVSQNITGYELIASGTGGNKVYDLYLRMPEDVIEQSPEIVIIWIGTNDVWHKQKHGTGTNADTFEKIYSIIIRQLQAVNIKIILVTPAVIGEKHDYSNPQDEDLKHYADIIQNMANHFNLPVCNLYNAFHLYEVNNNTANEYKGILTTDGVHLNMQGNKLAAEEIWNALKVYIHEI